MAKGHKVKGGAAADAHERSKDFLDPSEMEALLDSCSPSDNHCYLGPANHQSNSPRTGNTRMSPR